MDKGSSIDVVIPGGEAAVSREAWLAFCAEHGLEHSPALLGSYAFHAGQVRASFGEPKGAVFRPRQRAGDAPDLPESATQIAFSTIAEGAQAARVAELALAAQRAFGGTLVPGPGMRVHLDA